ncbi:MAG TPA: TIM barrel protein [Verrucomicrobiae bacterium]
MGFDGIELIVTARKDLQAFWTDARIDRLKQKLDGHKLRVSQFAMFQPVVEGLSSAQRDVRDQALDYFEGGCRIARKFESPLINIVAPWALELAYCSLVFLLCLPGFSVASAALLSRPRALAGQNNGAAGEHVAPVFPAIHLLHRTDKDARASQGYAAVTLELLQLFQLLQV